MSLHQVLFGIFELLISILVSFVLIFATYRAILALTRRFDEETLPGVHEVAPDSLV